MKNIRSIDWKILSEDVKGQSICCHMLQANDCLQDLINRCEQSYSVALIIINIEDNYVIRESFLRGMVEVDFPVVILTLNDGLQLLHLLQSKGQDDVEAKIDAVSVMDTSSHDLRTNKAQRGQQIYDY